MRWGLETIEIAACQQVFDQLFLITQGQDLNCCLYSQFSFIILLSMIFYMQRFLYVGKPLTSGGKNTLNIIKHDVVVLYGHLFALQKNCSSL